MGTIPIHGHNRQPAIDVDQSHDAAAAAVVDASQVLLAVTDQAMATVADSVTGSQLRMMMLLHSCGPRTVSGLAGCLCLHPSTVTRTASRLITAGFLIRRLDPEQRRGTLIVLTPAGNTLVNTVLKRRRHAITRIIEDMSASDRRELVWALEALEEAASSLSASGRPSVAGAR